MDKFITKRTTAREDGPSSSKQQSDTNCGPPKDIAAIGENIIQIRLPSYPKNLDGRSFRKEWFERFTWIEYSPSRDAVFCYVCRQFQPHASKENVFSSIGFTNWKTALEKSKGLQKHDSSKIHILSMAMWTEKKLRLNTGQEVSTLVNEEVLQRNRYYVTSIAEIIQFLAVNELPMRRSYNIQEHEEQSLFKNMFEFTLRKDHRLMEYSKCIPRNATYLSPEIQNDVIQILAECVRESIVDDVKGADVPWFTIFADGTKDKRRRENFAIGIRYVKDGKAYESTLCIKTTNELDAQSLAELTLNTLQENGLKSDHLLSQCYDGAPVMSGQWGGLQAIIQQQLNRPIPYVHCCNHRLHLVVVNAINAVPAVKQFFDQCSMLYMFLKRGCVAKNYEGQALSRLLEQRWSGHLHVTDIIHKNYEAIVKVLKLVAASKEYDGDDVTEATGLLNVITKHQFRFCVVFTRKILKTLEPADKQLQARETSLNDSIKIIEAVIESIKIMRHEENCYEEIIQFSTTGSFEINEPEYRIKRRKIASSYLKDFVVMETTGTNQEVEPDTDLLKQIFSETLDIILSEMAMRFSDNKELLKAISAAEELDHDNIQHLSSLGILLPSKEELTVVKSYLQKNKIENCNIFQEIYSQKVAFENTYKLLATARTFGCSTALCESTFSVLTRIDRPQRLSMTHQRLANLTFLAFEKDQTNKVDLEIVLKKFNSMKNRRLQLF